MRYDGFNLDIVAALDTIERRLPPHVRQALENVPVVEVSALKNAWADAGEKDIRIAPLKRYFGQANLSIIVHELAHVYARHFERLHAGEDVAVLEAEADELVRRWGFTEELRERRLFYGK